MSWSIGMTGTKDELKSRFADQMAVFEKMYEGKPEADDVTAVKTRGLALLDAQVLPEGKLVSLAAFGSHSTSDGNVTNAVFEFKLGFVDAPPAPHPDTVPPAPETAP